MNLNPYLSFDGTCTEAFEFYAALFGGTVEARMTFGEGEMAAQFPPEMHDKVMHATLRIGDRAIMGSDNAGPQDTPVRGVHLQTGWPTLERARAVFEALAEGGEVTMPFAPTFFASGFGMCRDRFGVQWMVNVDDMPDGKD